MFEALSSSLHFTSLPSPDTGHRSLAWPLGAPEGTPPLQCCAAVGDGDGSFGGELAAEKEAASSEEGSVVRLFELVWRPR